MNTPLLDPTEAEMVELFGPQWQAIRDLIRRAAVLTAKETKALGAAWDAERDAARDAAWYAAWAAARRDAARRGAALDAARGAALGAAWYAAWDARGAAWGAAAALVVRDLIGQHGFTADHYLILTRAWATVIGPAHPDDIADGLVASAWNPNGMTADPNVVIDGEPWTVDEVRSLATGLRVLHDPNEQDDNPYSFRCAACHYVKHPCDTFNLASIVLALLPEEGAS